MVGRQGTAGTSDMHSWDFSPLYFAAVAAGVTALALSS